MQIVDIRLTKLLFCVHKPDKSEGRDFYSLCVSLNSSEKGDLGGGARRRRFHFRASAGAWRDTRTGEALGARLAQLLRDQVGLAADLAALPPPPG